MSAAHTPGSLWATLLAALLVAIICIAYAIAGNPSEYEATATVAMDLNDAITAAQAAAKGRQ